LSENAQAELMWNRNMTSFSERDAARESIRRYLIQTSTNFIFGLLYMLRNSEKKLRPFIAGGIGFRTTEQRKQFEQDLLLLRTSGGVKYYVTRPSAARGCAVGANVWQ